MSLRLWPADGIFLAVVHEDIVILDVAADRYIGLLDAARWVRPEADGSFLVNDEEVAVELQASGYLCAAPPRLPRIRPLPARAELATGRPPTTAVGLAGLVLAKDSLAFRGKTLTQLVAAASRPGRPGCPTDPRALAAAVTAFRTALPFIPFEGECLQRGFQLKRLLDRKGLSANWVFGVNTWPFSAHCWLQQDDLVLGDRLERVRLYTPIMVV